MSSLRTSPSTNPGAGTVRAAQRAPAGQAGKNKKPLRHGVFAVNKNEICLAEIAEIAEITEILFPNTRSALATLHI